MSPDDPDERAGDADRDRLAAALGLHYAAGRLDLAELDRRLELVLSADTLREASAPLADLPPLPAPAAKTGGERGRHGEAARPQPGWIPTLERFRDPSTERVMRVWIDPADGSRHYVAEAPGT